MSTRVSDWVCVSVYVCVCVCEVQVKSSLPPWLAAEHAHAGHVDADEPPGHQVFEGGQRSYESVWVGAVGVPVSGVDSQAARAAGARAVAQRLEEVLLLVDIVDFDVRQHRHLVARDVRGLGFVAHPDADALAHRVHPAVLRLARPPAGPTAGPALWRRRLCIGGLGAEVHPGREEVALGEEFGVHRGDGAGTWMLLLLCRGGGTRVPSDGGHSPGTEEEEQDQHGRPHGHTTWGGGNRHTIHSVIIDIQNIYIVFLTLNL